MRIAGTRNLVCAMISAAACLMTGCGGSSGGGGTSQETEQTVTLHPIMDFYINQSDYTNPPSLWGYGVDTHGTEASGRTGSETGGSGSDSYHTTAKLIYNFHISDLNGATIKSASFRVYQAIVGGADAPENAILENIFYGNTDGLPATPRSYPSEMSGYVVSPAISATQTTTAIGWKTFDLAEKLQADITAGRSNSQLRMTHANASSLLNFYCDWNMADNATNPPELVVTYTK